MRFLSFFLFGKGPNVVFIKEEDLHSDCANVNQGIMTPVIEVIRILTETIYSTCAIRAALTTHTSGLSTKGR